MASGLIPAFATLTGVIVGAFASFLSQDRHWKREARRQVYGLFVGKSTTWLDALLRVSFTIREGWTSTDRAAWWDLANDARAAVAALRGQVDMVAKGATWAAADQLDSRLRELHDEIFRHEWEATDPHPDAHYRKAIEPFMERFVGAARDELGISRASR